MKNKLDGTSKVPWRIDPAEELPLAVIEDTEDGMGVYEIGERTKENLAYARKLVRDHNNSLKKANR